MAKKTFAMLNTSILHSRPFRELNCSDRNLYFTAHLSVQADFCGLFRYPISLIADETQQSIPDVRASLARLCRLGLIEYDSDAELIRICGWFRSVNCPKNADHTRQVARHFLSGELPVSDMSRRTVAEFAIGCLLQTKTFKPASQHGGRVVEEIRRFLADAWTMYEDLLPMLEEEYCQHGSAISFEYQSLTIGALGQEAASRLGTVTGESHQGQGTVPPPSLHPALTVAPQRERNKEIEEDGQVPSCRPLPETLNSPMVQSLLAKRA